MVKNHISLVVSYIDQLMALAMIQNWIDTSREAHSDNQKVQLEMDRQQAEVIERKTKLQDEMFEISRRN